ncbi:MAG TPA: choice-of-anchor tandem repeat GloVer-containing protein [Rhizomicrobium sp.]
MTKFPARMVGLVLTCCLPIVPQAYAASEKIIYSFKGGSDGANPYAGLIATGGKFYSTTTNGGVGNGTVFSLTPGGAEKVVYAFKGFADGAFPDSGLLPINGSFYGTTPIGGGSGCGGNGYGCGTVFSLTPAGAEKVVHSFKGGSDGAAPHAGLSDVSGTLYGTTLYGGTGPCNANLPGCGTVFSVTPAGAEKVVHDFKGGADGENPNAALLNEAGTLYGTTLNGGINGNYKNFGTAFSVTTAGAEKVVYAFVPANGEAPASALSNGGTLYGTALYAGSGHCSNANAPSGCGTVFAVTKAGVAKVIHSFQGGSDGAIPYAGLIGVGGKLYGTTESGGGTGCGGSGCGTVFSVTPSGTETVLYSFKGGSDGNFPYARLYNDGGTLYGTTEQGGGSANCSGGCGTVFSITP